MFWDNFFYKKSKIMIFNLEFFSKILLSLLLTFFLTIVPLTSSSLAINLDQGAKLFKINCAGCHANGGNIIRRGKSFKKRALKRNGFESIAAISQIVTQGKGIMSAYADRLTAEEIDTVSGYVWQQAEQGWKK